MSAGLTRVLHITHDMGVGGAEQVIRQLATDVDTTRFDSRVVCIDSPVGPIGEELRASGVTVHSLSRRPGFDRVLIGALRRLLRDEEIDVVHCHQYTPYCYGVLAAAFTRTRVVFTEHGRFHPDRHSWKRRLANQVLVRLTDRTVAISVATRDALIEHEWFPRHAIEVIYNGVRPPRHDATARPVRERHGMAAGAKVLGTIARLDPIKNQAMMLEALAALRANGSEDIVLLIAGDGPERAALERRAAELDLVEAVVFAGFVTDIAEHLDAIDVFLLTSWSEGTSMTLLEAMAFGKPIVTTRVGGSVEILDDERTALFVEAGDVEALVDALARVLDDDALRARLGEGARKDFHRRFESRRMIAAYEGLYG